MYLLEKGDTTMTAWGSLESTPKKTSEGGQNSINKVLPEHAMHAQRR
jgi:hypothetical protein